MPKTEISFHQEDELDSWTFKHGGSKNKLSKSGEGGRELTKVCEIKGEPLVIYKENMYDLLSRRTLSCSRAIGRQLEKAGIVKFPDEPKRLLDLV